MNIKKRIASLAVTASVILSCTAVSPESFIAHSANSEIISGGFVFKFTEDGASLMVNSYTGASAVVTVPQTVDGYTVTEIHQYAFYENETITSVTLPDTIKVIGASAFGHCKNLETINMPSELEIIDEYAFTTCHALEDVTFGDMVKSIGFCSFQLCINFDKVTIPGTVGTVVDHAFHGLQGATEIRFGEGIHTIESGAVLNCYSVDRLYFPKTLTEIGDHSVAYSVWGNEYTPISNVVAFGSIETPALEYSLNSNLDFIPYEIGDINKSGDITASDASDVLSEYADVSTGEISSYDSKNKRKADVNFDGKITPTDASEILGYYAYTATGGALEVHDYFYQQYFG